MAASPGPDDVAAGSEEKVSRSAAGCGILRAIVLVLMAVVAVAVPVFHGHPVSQVWIISLSICAYVFFFLLCICRSRWFYIDFVLLSHGPLLAFFSASVIGSVTTTFVLFFTTVWAAGNLGYSLAVHRMREGTEPAIHALPIPSCPTTTRDSVKNLNFYLHIVEPFVMLLWTSVMPLIVYLAPLTDELEIFTILLYFGWMHAAIWVVIVVVVPMHGVLFREWMRWFMCSLLAWVIFSPLLSIVSMIPMVLCNFLLMIVLVAFLWYNLAIYMHYLETATPSTTAQGNEETLRSGILEHEIWPVKSDPTLGETQSEAAATPPAV